MTYPVKKLHELENDSIIVIDPKSDLEKGLALCYNQDKRYHFLIKESQLNGRDKVLRLNY